MHSKLCHADDRSYGCILALADGATVRLEIGYEDLDTHLRSTGFPSLREVCEEGTADVFYHPVQMTAEEWHTISEILVRSPVVAEVLVDFPVLECRLHLTYDVVSNLAQRVYGGIGEPFPGVNPTFYVSRPINFSRTDDLGDAKRYALLSHRGGHLFKTHVDLQTGEVTMEYGVIKNHFIERSS